MASSGLLTRRGLIGGLLGLVAAPAIVRASSLMPVRVMPPDEVLQRWEVSYHWRAVRDLAEGAEWESVLYTCPDDPLQTVTIKRLKPIWSMQGDRPVEQIQTQTF